MFYAYILRSEPYPGRVYHGYTSDLRRRLTDHNSGDNVSTRNGRPWAIAWYGVFETEAAAMAFERYLNPASGKALSRPADSVNPGLRRPAAVARLRPAAACRR